MGLAIALGWAALGGLSSGDSGDGVRLGDRYPGRPAATTPPTPLSWDSGPEHVYRLQHFRFDDGERLQLTAGPSTLVLGVSGQAAIWAAVLPDDPGEIAGELPGAGEPLVQLYLRFEPAEVQSLFPPTTVSAAPAGSTAALGIQLALSKLGTSWHLGGRPVCPPEGTLVFDCDTAECGDEAGPGRRRFYMREGAQAPLVYHAAFERVALPRDLCISPAEAEAALLAVHGAFAAEYAYFELRELDWSAARDGLAARARTVQTSADLAVAVTELLAPLHDRHAWVRIGERTLPNGPLNPDFRANFQALRAALGPLTQERQGLLFGRTADGIGYLALNALDDRGRWDELDRALAALADVRALIVDLRFNGGGDETIAQGLAGRFTSEERLYAQHRFRAGPGPRDLGPWQQRHLLPRGEPVTVPLRVLIGPAMMSSAESFALMFAALDQARLVGVRTAGSSGNPRTLELVGGVTVAVPRWFAATPEGMPIEGRGVAPDLEVTAEASAYAAADPTFDTALADLRHHLER
jgi:carboxyl-terminal processing protease